MRLAWAFALIILPGCAGLAGKTAPAVPLASEPITACTEPRPQLCTLQYAPACASLVAGGFRTYASACNACADPAVAGYQNEPCRE